MNRLYNFLDRLAVWLGLSPRLVPIPVKKDDRK
jgi:hypothetical protein